MTERWRERAPTSAAEAYHDLRVADSLAEEMRAAGEAGYMDAAYLRASQAENGESGTVEDGKAWWR